MLNRKLKNSELERKSPEEFKRAPKVPLLVILDNVRSLNNVGSVFRTCDAFLVEKIGKYWRPHFFVENSLRGFLEK